MEKCEDWMEMEDKTGKMEHRLSLEASGKALPSGKFEVLAITAGEGNGWYFPAAALKASLPLWEGVFCYIDHDRRARSVRDISGVLREPRWDEEAQGVRAVLEAFGPGAALLTELGKRVLEGEKEAIAHIGFSADVLFTGRNRRVEKILKVFSVDLVTDPARGGAFVRQLNQVQVENGGITMSDQVQEPAVEKEPVNEFTTLAEEAHAVRLQMCAYLLDSALGAAKLPKPVSQRLRAQFEGQIFESEALKAAIEDARTMVGELTGADTIYGPGRISGMVTSEERLQAAVDDLFGAPRDEKGKALSVAKLSGIRELYLTLTGDVDLHGGYFPNRTQLATTADFTGLVKNALNKLVVNTWEALGRAGYNWWQ
jgi:hypothetical protein